MIINIYKNDSLLETVQVPTIEEANTYVLQSEATSFKEVKNYCVTDSEGFFIEKVYCVLLEDKKETYIDIESPFEGRFIKPKYATGKWVEGDTSGVALSNLVSMMRVRRDALLKECDWTILPDSPLTADQKQAWTSYRQQLRDLPNTITSLRDDVIFPEHP
jgi:hypothetical protein